MAFQCLKTLPHLVSEGRCAPGRFAKFDYFCSVLPLTNGQLVHDLSYALDAADISNARAQRNVSFICITFQHADTQPA
ncbi:hypothetical protein ACFK1O_000242 [Salmonella enterica]